MEEPAMDLRLLYEMGAGRFRPVPDNFWSLLLSRACDEGIAGLIHFHAENSAHAGFPDDVKTRLRRIRMGILAADTRIAGLLYSLDHLFREHGAQAMVFKGAALLFTHYPEPGIRPMEDIDIFPRQWCFDKVVSLFAMAGFKRILGAGRMFSAGGVSVDLHRDLFHSDRYPERRGFMTFDPFLRSFILPGFHSLCIPHPADHLVVLAIHAVKHGFSKMIWLEDIVRLVSNLDQKGMRLLSEYAANPFTARILAQVFGLIREIYPGSWETIISGLSLPALSFVEKGIIRQKATRGYIGDLGNLLFLFAIPSFRSRISFVSSFFSGVRRHGDNAVKSKPLPGFLRLVSGSGLLLRSIFDLSGYKN